MISDKKLSDTLTLKSIDLQNRDNDFKIIFKCMSGGTTENGKGAPPSGPIFFKKRSNQPGHEFF